MTRSQRSYRARQRATAPALRRGSTSCAVKIVPPVDDVAQRGEVELGEGRPLPVHDVRPPAPRARHERREPGRVSGQLERRAQRAARPCSHELLEHGPERLAPAIAVRGGCDAVHEGGGHELDVMAAGSQRLAQCVVVPGRVRLRIDDDDPHHLRGYLRHDRDHARVRGRRVAGG